DRAGQAATGQTQSRRLPDALADSTMGTHNTPISNQIARTGARALAVRSSALVARGLRDLTRDSNWLIKKVFTGRSQHLAISPTGEVCAISAHVHHGKAQVALYDIELSVPTMTLTVPAGGVTV